MQHLVDADLVSAAGEVEERVRCFSSTNAGGAGAVGWFGAL